MSVGKRIKERRKELGLSVEQVADILGKNRATIYRYESDEIENLPITIIEPLAEILKVSPSYLMGWDQVEEDYHFSSTLGKLYYDGIMKWSEDKLLRKHEAAIIKSHIAELFIRYKELIEAYVYAQHGWRNSGKDFLKFYKQNSKQLTDSEIKKLFLNQEMERRIDSMVTWVEYLPDFIILKEEEYLSEIDKKKEISQELPNAANEIDGASEEDKIHDESIMDDDDF